jgi:tetratricopeptide (TPR) repeat protein
MEIIAILLVVVSSFLIRALPRIILKNALTSDTYYHLKCANDIRRNSFFIPKKIEQGVLPHQYNYPFGYHLLLAFFPEKARLWLERLTGAIFDTSNVIILFWFTKWLIEQSGDPRRTYIPILVTALYAFSPALLRTGSGPRAYNGSPRVFGQTLYLVHLITAYHYHVTNSSYSIVMSLLAGACLICSAKFGSQVLLLFGIFFSVFVASSYFILLVGCLLLAIIISNGLAWNIVKSQFGYSILYAKYLQQVFLFPHIKSVSTYINTLKSVLTSAFKKRSLSDFMDWYYREQYFGHHLLTVFPQYFIFFALITITGKLNPQEYFLLIWMSAAFFWFLLTKYKYMLFLGEGERYAEYGLFPSYYLLVAYCPKGLEFFLYLYLVYSIGSAIFFAKDYIKRHRSINDDFSASAGLFTYLNALPPGVILPVGWVHHQALYRSSFPIVSLLGNADPKIFPVQDFIFYFSNYPYPPKDFDQVTEKYNVSYILAERSCLQHYLTQLADPTIFLDSSILLAESSTLLLFKNKKDLNEKYQGLNDFIAETRLEEAMDVLSELMLFMQNDIELNTTKGIIELHLGKYEDAFTSFTRLLAIAPKHVTAYVGLAQASLMLGDHNKADLILCSALKLDPYCESAQQMLDELRLGPNFESTLPSSIDDLLNYATKLIASEMYENSNRILATLLMHFPEHAGALKLKKLISLIESK